MDSYDDAYREAKHLFGSDPDQILVGHWREIDRSAAVLDLGAGQGRNALFLARNGHEVEALDPSRVAVDGLTALSRDQGLPIRVTRASFEEHPPTCGPYSAVLLFGLIQILPREGIEDLIRRSRLWTRDGGLVFVTAFTTLDGTAKGCAEQWREVGVGSYTDGEGGFRTYLTPGELPDLMCRFEIVHHWEGLGPEHRHGDGEPERHQMVEGVFRR